MAQTALGAAWRERMEPGKPLYLDNISDDEIPALNIPTGFSLVYELEEDLKVREHYYLGDADKIQEATSSVAAQASIADNGRSEGST